jgi:hypothetical protein
VPYSRLFPSGHCAAEAIIGGSPLVVHTAIVTLGILLLQRQRIQIFVPFAPFCGYINL